MLSLTISSGELWAPSAWGHVKAPLEAKKKLATGIMLAINEASMEISERIHHYKSTLEQARFKYEHKIRGSEIKSGTLRSSELPSFLKTNVGEQQPVSTKKGKEAVFGFANKHQGEQPMSTVVQQTTKPTGEARICIW